MNLEEDTNVKQKLEFTHKYAHIMNLIDRATTISDLDAIVYKLLPLSELKQLLISKLTQLNDNNNNNKLSVHELYYNCTPFDEIFSDDIICNCLQYLAAYNDSDNDYMYNKLPIINKHFNNLMRRKPILYQQYKICVSLNDDLWKKRKSILIQISHQTKSIYIIDPVGASYFTSKQSEKYKICFEILNLDDMNNKCPFIWYCIKKWHIVSCMNANRLYSHNLYQYYNNKRVERVNRMYYSNDFSGYVSPTDSLDLTPTYRSNRRSSFFNDKQNIIDHNKQKQKTKTTKTNGRMDRLTENNSIMKQLLDKAAVHIKSIQIDNNDNNTKRALKNFFWLNKLFHIKSLSHDIMSFYNIKNLCYLDLIQTIHCKRFDILRELKQLLVIKLNLNDHIQQNMQNTTNDGGDHENEEKQWLITFPSNIEFIQINNFSNSSSYLLNFNECKNIIAILLKDSKIFQWDISNYYTKRYQSKNDNNTYRQIENCVIWPNRTNPIECILFDDGIETRCIDNWYEYFQKQRVNGSSIIPIRYIRYRIMPTILTHCAVPNSPIPQLAFYKQFNEEKEENQMLFLETKSDIIHHSNNYDSNDHDSNAATVDDNLSMRSTLPSIVTTNSNNTNNTNTTITIPPLKLDVSNTDKTHHLEEEEEKLYVPITPPSINSINAKSKMKSNQQQQQQTEREREISWTESSYNCTDSGTTTGAACHSLWALEKGLSGSASLDEEEEMKTIITSTKHIPLTKDMLDKYVVGMINVNGNNYNNYNDKQIEINEETESESKIIRINDIKTNDAFCMILDDKNNDGLLWRLLLELKFSNGTDEFIADRISMYKKWFAMNIGKWIYNLGYWTVNELNVPFSTIESPPTNINRIQRINNISSHHSQPNVQRRSATINTSPTVSSSPSVVDSLELYLQ